MTTEYRFADFEFRAGAEGSPGTLTGTAMRYGDVAMLPGGVRERFEPGAFGADVERADVMANWQHARASPLGRTGGGGLTLTDAPAALRVELVLPDTAAGRDVAELAARRVLRGFSVEFRAAVDRFEAGVRVVQRAALSGLAVVDRPAYGDSLAALQARAARGSGIGAVAGGARRRIWL